MGPDDQEVIDAKQCRRHDHGVASSVLSARVKDEHEDPEHDEASLAGLPHGPSFRDVGDAWGKAVHLDDAAGAAEWDHDEAHAVGQAEVESSRGKKQVRQSTACQRHRASHLNSLPGCRQQAERHPVPRPRFPHLHETPAPPNPLPLPQPLRVPQRWELQESANPSSPPKPRQATLPRARPAPLQVSSAGPPPPVSASVAGGKSIYSSVIYGARRPGQQVSAVPAGFGADALISQQQASVAPSAASASVSPSRVPHSTAFKSSHPSRLVSSKLPTTTAGGSGGGGGSVCPSRTPSQTPTITPKVSGTMASGQPSVLGSTTTTSKAPHPASQTPQSAIPSILGVSKLPTGSSSSSSRLPTATLAAAVSQIPGRSVIPAPGGRVLETAYTNPADLRHAEQQLKYKSLTDEQRVLQDAWANRKGLEMAPCPNNYGWERHWRCPGYQCSGSMHYIPDVLIAEGVPGLYTQMPPPRGLLEAMTPHPSQKIPSGFFGPVRPLRQDPDTMRWIFPSWSYS
ncbi:hypothetical protein G7054_g10232 [Neopestalotiopsis clavispora]|nr:hypothetical protein G7054_g10232 [Neopestalotiopsis clavispora]